MNLTNIDKAIAIMRRAQNLYMPNFQAGRRTVETEAELHACGNTACFAGYVAISPEFRADGGMVDSWGAPVLEGHMASRAIAAWLDIHDELAEALVHDGVDPIYDKPFGDVTPQDVIDRLEAIKTGELA